MTRYMKPTVDVVQPLINAVYERAGAYSCGCCLFQPLENGHGDNWWVSHSLDQAREMGHLDCAHALGLIRLMSCTQRSKLRAPR
jgi:hypothetical protein